jgi:Putative addiction module component
MTVQTIPAIDEMTPAQQIELMEALWQSMSERNTNSDPPNWHREYLADREKALASGEDTFITLDELEADLRSELGR